ncbi:MAG: hypothetical protein ACLPLP_12115 [Mycobacterium sp.]
MSLRATVTTPISEDDHGNEVQRLPDSCDSDPAGVRDYAILLLRCTATPR